MKAWIFATAAILLSATPAIASRYQIVGADESEGTVIAIDLDTIRPLNGYNRAWVLSTLVMDGGKHTWANALYEFDCKQERHHVLASTLYDMQGKSIEDMGPMPWAYSIPNTGGFNAMEYACGTKTVAAGEGINLSGSVFAQRAFDYHASLKRTKK